jgi:iron complex outermembrane recepter protein
MAKWMIALMAGAAQLPGAAYAQAAPATGDGTDIAGRPTDIVVTAQRYQQRLQDVPLSVSVIGAKELAARASTALSDLQYSVPGLSLFEYGPGKSVIQMRGIATTNGASTVGIYLDETPLTTDLQGDSIPVRLVDMERVEVLRGPQATLYGEGSMGGTIRYIPAAPRFDAIGGSVDAELNRTKDGATGYKVTAVANLPLSDVAAVRLVGNYERAGGFIDAVNTGRKNINDTDQYMVRGILRAQPSDALGLSLLLLHQKVTQDNQDFGIDRQTASTLLQYNRDRMTLIQGKFDNDVGFATLEGSASYIHRKSTSLSDLTPFYVPALVAPPPFGFGLPADFITQIGYPIDNRSRIFNGELRLGSQGARFGWQLGATYRKLKADVDSLALTAPNALPLDLLKGVQSTDIAYRAVYGEVNYALTEKLKATAGVRYFSQRKRQVNDVTNFGVNTVDIGKATFETVNPRINLAYEISRNSMVFVNVAKGFRGGGFNPTSAGGGVFTIPPTYDPDAAWTYEVGTKHQLLGNRLIFDASLYRTEWRNVQSYAFVPGSPLTVTSNSGDVSGWGVDLSVIARPLPYVTLTGTYGWNDLAFDGATADKAKGDPVDGAVRKAWSVSADIRPPLTDGVTGILRVDYQHAGKAQITIRNFGGVVPRPSRDLVNLRIGTAFGATEITLFANNLFDEDASNLVAPFGVISEDLAQRPRVIGIGASTKF